MSSRDRRGRPASRRNSDRGHPGTPQRHAMKSRSGDYRDKDAPARRLRLRPHRQLRSCRAPPHHTRRFASPTPILRASSLGPTVWSQAFVFGPLSSLCRWELASDVSAVVWRGDRLRGFGAPCIRRLGSWEDLLVEARSPSLNRDVVRWAGAPKCARNLGGVGRPRCASMDPPMGQRMLKAQPLSTSALGDGVARDTRVSCRSEADVTKSRAT